MPLRCDSIRDPPRDRCAAPLSDWSGVEAIANGASTRVKRIDPLRILSDEHHTALVLGQRCRQAQPEDHVDMAHRARLVFRDELAPHFAIEETHLLPALEAIDEQLLAERIRADHAALRKLIAGDGTRVDVIAFGERLMAHVRFEEREVFEPTQHRLSQEALTAIDAACRGAARRRSVRPGDDRS